MRLVRVAVPVPALDSLTYSLPDGVPVPASGARVLVPLGARVLTGCVLESGVREPAERAIKPIIQLLDEDEPFLPSDVIHLATWVAEYYACGIGEALATAMPPLAASTEPTAGTPATAFKTIRIAACHGAGTRSCRRVTRRAAWRKAA